MSKEFEGKVAVVTGGASGIGRATAELFVERGAKVMIADIETERGRAVADQLGDSARFTPTDVADPDQVQGLIDDAIEAFGGLDVMFNNAGISSSFHRFLREELADLEKVMAVNLFGVMFGSQRAARYMAEHGGGAIINTSSIGALSGGGPPIAYRTSKAAIIEFSRAIATDLAQYGIRVNCIAPGHIATEITNYDLTPVIRTNQPLQREGSPRDVAEAVLFLASERAAQITGIVVPIDGGTVAGPPLGQLKVLRAGLAALDAD
jgi:NAD(P)-dependent dehydrogenase (short-subunit alcohol dehydrogenase family)